MAPKTDTDQNDFFHLKPNTRSEEAGFWGPCYAVSLPTQLSLVFVSWQPFQVSWPESVVTTEKSPLAGHILCNLAGNLKFACSGPRSVCLSASL